MQQTPHQILGHKGQEQTWIQDLLIQDQDQDKDLTKTRTKTKTLKFQDQDQDQNSEVQD